MNKIQVAQLVAERYQFGHYFCQLLENLLDKTPEGQIKATLKQNLDEEMGRSPNYPGSAHKEGRKCLLKALGFCYENWEPQGSINKLDLLRLSSSAKQVLEKFKLLVDNPNYLVGSSAIATSENLVPQQYRLIVSLLREFWPELSNDNLSHLLDHIEHDVHHGNELDILLASEPDQAAVVYGKKQAERAWKRFWQTALPGD